jgi:hypothetical protein
MRANEKQMMIDTYKDQFNYYFLSGEKSERELTRLNAMKDMMKLFFTKQEIMNIENSVRITSVYGKSHFESLESWQRQIEKEQGLKAFPFSWTIEGLELIEQEYDFIYNSMDQYKGMKIALDFAYKTLNKEAA